MCLSQKFHFCNFRDEALENARQKINAMQAKLDSVYARHKAEKETWEVDLQNLEETWRCNIPELDIMYFQFIVFVCVEDSY